MLLRAVGALGADVLALGHHAEDFGETLLMNLIFSGTCEGMAPHLKYFGRYSVVRPLVYITKREIRSLARALNFPDPPPACPLTQDAKRSSIRFMVQSLAKRNRHVITNLMSASLKSLGLRKSRTPPIFPLILPPGQEDSSPV